jgi:hypothetical protein
MMMSTKKWDVVMVAEWEVEDEKRVESPGAPQKDATAAVTRTKD